MIVWAALSVGISWGTNKNDGIEPPTTTKYHIQKQGQEHD